MIGRDVANAYTDGPPPGDPPVDLPRDPFDRRVEVELPAEVSIAE